MKRLKELSLGCLLVVAVILFDNHIFKENRMKNKGWWLVSFALLGVLLGLLGCARVVRYEPIPVLIADSMPVMGKTVCDIRTNRPVVFIIKGLSGAGMSEVVYHEMVHSRQALEYSGGCNAMLLRYSRDRTFAYEVEAQAYCETIHRFLPNSEWTRAKETLKAMLYAVAARGMSRTEADEIVNRFCQSTGYQVMADGTVTIPP